MLQLRTQYLSGLRQTLIYRKTIDHSSNCGNISRYICLICFGQKKNTVEAYFTNSSLQSRDSFPGIQGKLEIYFLLNLFLLTTGNHLENHQSCTQEPRYSYKGRGIIYP